MQQDRAYRLRRASELRGHIRSRKIAVLPRSNATHSASHCARLNCPSFRRRISDTNLLG